MPRFDYRQVEEFATGLLCAAGLGADDARLTAALLVKADLRGYPAHGVAHTPAYLQRIKDGLLQVKEPPKILREGPTSAVIDGNHCFGQVVASRAMGLAIEKARQQGVGVVVVHRSGHMGRLADYVEMAANEGMIGIGMISVGGASIPAHGGMSGVAGTNPFAVGIPGRDGQHFVLDMATAAMSRGELNRRGTRGELIPEGVFLDGYGNPTTDFSVFNRQPRGILLPFGGYKGSGVHLVTEILGGLLSGNGLGRDWRDKGGPAINGAYLQAARIDEFMPLEEFLDLMGEYSTFVQASEVRPGFDGVYIPGERARQVEERHKAEGIEIDEKEWDRLVRCASELGVTGVPDPLPAEA